MLAIGCDPGSSGYLCAIWDNSPQPQLQVDWLPMPFIETGKRISEVDVDKIISWVGSLPRPSFFVLEDVGYMPAGKTGFGGSAFSDATLSRRVGEIVGMLKTLKTIPYELVAPRKWQGELDIKVVKIKDEKSAARKKRIKAATVAWCGRRYPHVSLIPGRCKTPQDGMADALALAHVAMTRCLRPTLS